MMEPELVELKPAERSRTYFFPGGERVHVENVTHFLCRSSGTHRLKTADGKFHIVPTGWLHIELDMDAFTL